MCWIMVSSFVTFLALLDFSWLHIIQSSLDFEILTSIPFTSFVFVHLWRHHPNSDYWTTFLHPSFKFDFEWIDWMLMKCIIKLKKFYSMGILSCFWLSITLQYFFIFFLSTKVHPSIKAHSILSLLSEWNYQNQILILLLVGSNCNSYPIRMANGTVTK